MREGRKEGRERGRNGEEGNEGGREGGKERLLTLPWGSLLAASFHRSWNTSSVISTPTFSNILLTCWALLGWKKSLSKTPLLE